MTVSSVCVHGTARASCIVCLQAQVESLEANSTGWEEDARRYAKDAEYWKGMYKKANEQLLAVRECNLQHSSELLRVRRELADVQAIPCRCGTGMLCARHIKRQDYKAPAVIPLEGFHMPPGLFTGHLVEAWKTYVIDVAGFLE